MNIHKNAKPTPLGRAEIVHRVPEEGQTPMAVATAVGVCERTVRKWVARFRAEGSQGLQDRSSRPHTLRQPTPAPVVQQIATLRRRRCTGAQIAAELGVSTATVSRVLRRLGLNRLNALGPAEPVRRYERKHPGELVHIDIKKLGRFDRTGQSNSRGVDWEYLHVCIDDHSRVAFSQIMPDEKKESATAFLRDAIAYYRSLGVTVEQARKLAQNLLGQVAGGADPAYERARARAMPTLGDAFEEYMAVNPNRSKRTDELYRYEANRYLGDWLTRTLDSIVRRDVEVRFNSITADHGWSAANRAISLLRSVYRRPCVDWDGLRNPVDLWLAGGGKFHRKTRRKISTPAEVLPCWRAGIEEEVNNPAIRDALWFGLYTGMRREEVLTLRWERVDMEGLTFRVEDTKTGVPLELPITRQLAAILERRQAEAGDYPDHVREWVFPSSTSATGHVQDPHHLYARIGETGGAKFWFHGLRNSFITVAERELMLPPSLTKRLVNHARPNDVTEGYAAD